MAIRETAELDYRPDGKEYIYNVSVTNEEDYDLLRELWPAWTGKRLQWLSELQPAEPYLPPPWIGWVLLDDGWHPASDAPL